MKDPCARIGPRFLFRGETREEVERLQRDWQSGRFRFHFHAEPDALTLFYDEHEVSLAPVLWERDGEDVRVEFRAIRGMWDAFGDEPRAVRPAPLPRITSEEIFRHSPGGQMKLARWAAMARLGIRLSRYVERILEAYPPDPGLTDDYIASVAEEFGIRKSRCNDVASSAA